MIQPCFHYKQYEISYYGGSNPPTPACRGYDKISRLDKISGNSYGCSCLQNIKNKTMCQQVSLPEPLLKVYGATSRDLSWHQFRSRSPAGELLFWFPWLCKAFIASVTPALTRVNSVSSRLVRSELASSSVRSRRDFFWNRSLLLCASSSRARVRSSSTPSSRFAPSSWRIFAVNDPSSSSCALTSSYVFFECRENWQV